MTRLTGRVPRGCDDGVEMCCVARKLLQGLRPCLCPRYGLFDRSPEIGAEWQADVARVTPWQLWDNRGDIEAGPAGRTVFGHPIGLTNLFGVELWERFSFYGMLTILGYYLYYSLTDGGLGLPKTTATGIVGAYGGLVYLSTVLGGWIADRVLGMERTVFYGGVVVMCGHIALAVVPGLAGVAVGLVLVALGSGALKANASSLLGTLYEKGDAARRRRIHPVLPGHQPRRVRRPADHRPAADPTGVPLGLRCRGRRDGAGAHAVRRVPAQPRRPRPRRAEPVAAQRYWLGRRRWRCHGLAVIVAAFATGLVKLANLSQVTTGVIVVASVAYFVVMLTSSKVAPIERTRVRAFIPLFIANAVFWSLFQQIFTVLAVYSDERMNWSIFGWTAPSSWIGSIEPVWIILLSPLFAIMWTRLGTGRRPPRESSPTASSAWVSAFLLFLPMSGTTGRAVPALLVLAIMAVFAVSELLLSPIGLSVTTKLAPEAFRAQMMALYFFSVGIGTSMSGVLSGYYDPRTRVRLLRHPRRGRGRRRWESYSPCIRVCGHKVVPDGARVH